MGVLSSLFSSVNPLSAIATGAQGLLGIGQAIAGFAQKKPEMQEYQIPDEVRQNMSDAEYYKFQGLPEAQKQQYIENIQRSGATALKQSTSRKGGLGLIASVAQQQGDQYMNLLSADSEARMRNVDRLFTARAEVAREKEKQFQVKRENILQRRSEIDKLRGAGLQNTMGTLGSLSLLGSPSSGGSNSQSGTDENSGG